MNPMTLLLSLKEIKEVMREMRDDLRAIRRHFVPDRNVEK